MKLSDSEEKQTKKIEYFIFVRLSISHLFEHQLLLYHSLTKGSDCNKTLVMTDLDFVMSLPSHFVYVYVLIEIKFQISFFELCHYHFKLKFGTDFMSSLFSLIIYCDIPYNISRDRLFSRFFLPFFEPIV